MTWFLYSKNSRINDTHSQGYYCQAKNYVASNWFFNTKYSASRNISIPNIDRDRDMVGRGQGGGRERTGRGQGEDRETYHATSCPCGTGHKNKMKK
jgi:hypothetical protein